MCVLFRNRIQLLVFNFFRRLWRGNRSHQLVNLLRFHLSICIYHLLPPFPHGIYHRLRDDLSWTRIHDFVHVGNQLWVLFMHKRCGITRIRRRVHHRAPLLSSRLGDYRFQFARVSWKFSRSLNRRRGSTTTTFTFDDRGGFEDGFPTGVGEVFRGCSAHLCLGNLVSQKEKGESVQVVFTRVLFLISCGV